MLSLHLHYRLIFSSLISLSIISLKDETAFVFNQLAKLDDLFEEGELLVIQLVVFRVSINSYNQRIVLKSHRTCEAEIFTSCRLNWRFHERLNTFICKPFGTHAYLRCCKG